MIAFVLGHEMAHHELGHVRQFPDWYPDFARNSTGYLTYRLAHIPRHILDHPQNERDADARSLELCLAAGYDPHKCIEFYDVAKEKILDLGGITSVFGRDDNILEEQPSIGNLIRHKAKTWLENHTTGYPYLIDRKDSAQRHLEDLLSAPEGTQVFLS